MAARRRISYVIPPPSEPPPLLQLPPHGVPRNGALGPLLVPLSSPGPPSPTSKWAQHPRHRLGVSCFALDTSTQLVGRASPEAILYTGGREGLTISWDLGVPMKRRTQRYGVTGRSVRRWEIMTNWTDDAIIEEDEGDEYRSDGDVLGEVTGKARRRIPADHSIPYEEQWETDTDAYQTLKLKANPPATRFRQAVQMHSDWINDILLCNYNQTLISASSDGTIKAWSPHVHGQSAPFHEPAVIGTHTDYVRCLAHCREQQWFASGSFDRTIKLWDVASASSKAEPLLTLNPPDGAGPKASIYALTTDPYGSVIASGSPERVIRMWDPRSGKRISKLVGHTDNIRAILISEDAKYLLTGSADASVKLWSLSSQRCLHTFTHHTESVWSLFSSHPALEVFYSGDRSGLVCKVDVEGCTDVSEGECIVLCQDAGSDRPVASGSEGINKIVAMDDSLLWTASGSSSVKRWRVPLRRAIRAAALSPEGAINIPVFPPPLLDSSRDYYPPQSGWRESFDLSSSRAKSQSPNRSLSVPRETRSRSSSPFASRSHRASLVPTIMSANIAANAELTIDPEREGEETWYGIPFESLVRLTSPNDSGFGMPGPSLRGNDPEVVTLYSAASVLSVPRVVRSPAHNASPQPGAPALRSGSPVNGNGTRARFNDESQTVHAVPRSRAAFDVREVAADAVPLRQEPDEVIHGDHGVVRCMMLNDRVHALTVNTAGEVAVWNVVRGVCLGRYASEEVAAASFCGSDKSASVAGGSTDGDGHSVAERQRSPREALETVRERIEGEAVVQSWSTLGTKTGVLTVHMSEKCFESEIYADEAGYGPERQFSEEMRLNIGKWVLKNLFYGFIREEQRQATRRAREHNSHETSQNRLQRGSAPVHIDFSVNYDARSRSSSDVSARSSSSIAFGPRGATIIRSPSMLPAVSPSVSAAPRSSPLMIPMIPLHGGVRESGLSPIPQSPTADATPLPLPRGSRDIQRPDMGSTTAPSAFPAPGSSDYFSLHARRPSLSTSTPDDFSSWGGKSTTSLTGSSEGGSQSPSTPTVGSWMGRIKAWKSPRRQASEPAGMVTLGSTITPAQVSATPDEVQEHVVTTMPKTSATMFAGIINPPPSSETPSLPLSPATAIMISEEAPSGWHTLYRGQVSSTGSDVHLLEDAMPMWLLECLLQNKVPTIPVTKISFVLMPSKETDRETLPELLNIAQSKLSASRFLRVRKLTNHVQDKLDKIAQGNHSPASATGTPRSSFERRSASSARGREREHHPRPKAEDQYEILCNGTVLPLDMTLAAVRQFVWRQSSELVMHYRRRIHYYHGYAQA